MYRQAAISSPVSVGGGSVAIGPAPGRSARARSGFLSNAPFICRIVADSLGLAIVLVSTSNELRQPSDRAHFHKTMISLTYFVDVKIWLDARHGSHRSKVFGTRGPALALPTSAFARRLA